METIYRTIDGKEFLDKDLAMAYEAELGKLGKFDMIGYSGNPVDTTECAAVVVLYDKLSADRFLELAKEQEDCCADGIDSGDIGIFVWDRCNDLYRFIDPDSMTPLRMAFSKWEEASVEKAFANEVAESEETDDLLPF